jgi:hypothetical protein
MASSPSRASTASRAGECTTGQAFADHQRSPAFQAYQRALFGLLARPSDTRVNRAPRTVVPEPSGPGDPRGAD